MYTRQIAPGDIARITGPLAPSRDSGQCAHGEVTVSGIRPGSGPAAHRDPASAPRRVPTVLPRRVLSAVIILLAVAGVAAVAQVLGTSADRALPARHSDVSVKLYDLGRDPSVPDAATVLRDQPDAKVEQPDTF